MAASAPKPIYILNGPNLNLLGTREPHIYGRASLTEIEAACAARAAQLGCAIVFRQSNHEGALVDWMHEAREKGSCVVINAGAYAHTSLALYDAALAIGVPVIEIHLSNPAAREGYRHKSFLAQAAKGVIAGFGAQSYVLAVEAAAALVAAGAPST